MQARLASEQSDNAKATDNSQSRSPTKPPPAHSPSVAGQAKATPDLQRTQHRTDRYLNAEDIRIDDDDVSDDAKDLSWATVLKRTFEQFLREERPNMVSLANSTTLPCVSKANQTYLAVWGMAQVLSEHMYAVCYRRT